MSETTRRGWENRIVGEGEEDPEQLLANPANFRIHPQQQQAVLTDVLDEVGWVQRVIVNTTTGHMVDGHLRAQLAISRGEKVPVTYVELTIDEERKMLASLDPIASLAVTDDAKLAELLEGMEVEGQAFGDWIAETGRKIAPQAEITEDEAPGLPARPVTRNGTVWRLGEHWLVCGNALSRPAYDKILGKDQADCIWTDPPYNVDYEGGTEDHLTIANDAMTDEAFSVFMRAAYDQMFAATRPGGAIYVCHPDTGGYAFRKGFIEAGFDLKECLVWIKDSLVLSRQDYHWRHEPILYGWKPGAAHSWYGSRALATVIDDETPLDKMSKTDLQVFVQEIRDGSTVIREPRPKRSPEHPTMKPVTLVARLIRNNAIAGDLILDPFGGSGSTLIAAEQLDMRARLIEIDPAYCDVIVERWENLTGGKAKRG